MAQTSPPGSDAAARPNVLWICTDSQRFDTLGCYGNRFVRTPCIDALAAQGVLCEQTYCQSPICTPSRGSFLTGRYPRTARSRQNGANIPSDEVLVTKLLRDGGYSCGLSGKLHISACFPPVCPDVERRIDDGYGEFHWSHEPGHRHPCNEYALWLREKGARQEFVARDDCKYVTKGMPAELNHTTWCALKAETFIRQRMEAPPQERRPWLFSVNIFDPHFYFEPPESYLQRYLDRLEDVPLPNFHPGELDNKPKPQRDDYEQHWSMWKHRLMNERDHRMIRAAYWAMCDLIDDAVASMLKALDETGQRDNTIVIFTSDHGEMLGDHGLYTKGAYFYDPAVRVPMIVHWPGKIEGGRRIPSLIELTDIAPTLLEAAGLPKYPGMQGRSLLSLLTGADATPVREDVYCEYLNAMPGRWAMPKEHATMLRTERYKMVAVHGAEPGELYDLHADPSETRNLWNDPAAANAKADMMKRLLDRIAFTMDPLPERIGVY